MHCLSVRWLFGSHEIERILGRKFSNEMAYLLEKYIDRSKQLECIQSALKSPSLDAHTMYQKIVSIKGLNTSSALHSKYIAPNLTRSLKMIQAYNAIIRDLEESVIPFDKTNKSHQDLLFSVNSAFHFTKCLLISLTYSYSFGRQCVH